MYYVNFKVLTRLNLCTLSKLSLKVRVKFQITVHRGSAFIRHKTARVKRATRSLEGENNNRSVESYIQRRCFYDYHVKRIGNEYRQHH